MVSRCCELHCIRGWLCPSQMGGFSKGFKIFEISCLCLRKKHMERAGWSKWRQELKKKCWKRQHFSWIKIHVLSLRCYILHLFRGKINETWLIPVLFCGGHHCMKSTRIKYAAELWGGFLSDSRWWLPGHYWETLDNQWKCKMENNEQWRCQSIHSDPLTGESPNSF